MKESRISLYLPPELEAEIKVLAKEHDRSLNGEITQAIRAWLATDHAQSTLTVLMSPADAQKYIASIGEIEAVTVAEPGGKGITRIVFVED